MLRLFLSPVSPTYGVVGSSVASSSPATAGGGGAGGGGGGVGALYTSTPLPFYTPAAAAEYYPHSPVHSPGTPYFTPRLPPPTPLLNHHHHHHHLHSYSQQVPSSRMGRPLNSPAGTCTTSSSSSSSNPSRAAASGAAVGGGGGAAAASAGPGARAPGVAQGVHTSNINTSNSSFSHLDSRGNNQPVPMDLDDPSAANPPPPPQPPHTNPYAANAAAAAAGAPSSLQPVPRNPANPYAARPASIAGGMRSPLTIGRPPPASSQNPATLETESSGGMRVFNPGHLAGLMRSQPSSSSSSSPTTSAPPHTHAHSVLALDMRPFQQYSEHRVLSSVNVSIPTTLLKRPAFTPVKMFGSLSSDHAKEVLKDWTNYANIVVFDNDSTVATDASPIKLLVGKLLLHANPDTRIGWLPGGFVAFKEAHPDLCDSSPPPKGSEGIGPAASGNKSAVQAMCLSELAGPLTAPSALGALGAGRPSLQPTYAAHTSVSNINSSDTLIGGIDVDNRALLPRFLREMMESGNVKGQIEEKFAAIEAAEKRRLDCSFRARSRTDPFSVSDALEGGATRNRYNNIWPFNHNRVKLAARKENASFAASANASMSPPPPTTSPNPHSAEAQTLSNDYINASHIMSPAGHRRYIATQGPIESTFDDFWRMSWQEKTRVILMLVADADVQSGSQTCHKYWPDPGASREFGRVRVTHTAERRVPFEPVLDANAGGGVILREFVVVVDADEASARTIWQVQYLGWPDHGVPKHADEMLQVHHLVSKLCAVLDRTYGKEDVGPVVVHCSAGCGRTGAFICIDAVLSALHTLGSLPSVSSLGTPTSPNPSPASGASLINLSNAFETPSAVASNHSGILPSQPLPQQQSQTSPAAAASSSSSSSHQQHHQYHHQHHHASRSAPGTPGATGGGPAHSPADTWSTVRAILTPNTFAPASSPHDMILAAVHHLRSQRVLMVQSLSQYAFCYEVVARCCTIAGIAAVTPPTLGGEWSDSEPSNNAGGAATTAHEKSHSSLMSGGGRTSSSPSAESAARVSVTRYTRIVRSNAVDETLAAFPTLAYQARNPKVNVRLPQSHGGGGGGAGFSGPGGRGLSGSDYDEADDRKRERAASLEEMTTGMQRTLKRV
ncbi:hypothetical protein HDU87_005516 [Geranomyces variabilis]|uniref:protein-tyrosine-phosphatase n=1 Tax=Geranomyces variabilis TaxID=109894 RepID=A0AAD5XL43_9FUNG|nr:hypothetical protein HDU87_005516 [Geranomyces variabilis]